MIKNKQTVFKTAEKKDKLLQKEQKSHLQLTFPENQWKSEIMIDLKDQKKISANL